MKYLPINVEWSAVSHFLKPDPISRATIGFDYHWGVPRPDNLHTCIGACGAITQVGKIPVIFGVIALAKTSYDQYRALEIVIILTHPDHPEAEKWLIEQAMKATRVLGFQFLFRREKGKPFFLHDTGVARLNSADQPALDV
jgi:hypothetical protein